MTVDLVVLGLVLLFAILGGFSGAARQVAQFVAMLAAYAACRPLGTFLAPYLAKSLAGPEVLSLIGATILSFIVVMLLVRLALTGVLRWLLRGEDDEDKGLDRSLGFLLGGLKAAFVAYLLLSGLTFVEQHLTVAGKKLGLSTGSSLSFDLARRYNFFELTQFGGVKDLLRVAKATEDPEKMAQLQQDPAFQKLKKDPRVKKALEDPAVRAAAERGDYKALLKNNAILQLIQDPKVAEQLEAAAERL